MKQKLPKIIDELTDTIAVVVIGAIAILSGAPSEMTLVAIASVALGKRIIKK